METPIALMKFQAEQLELKRRSCIRHLMNLKRSLVLTDQKKKHSKKNRFHLVRIRDEIKYTEARILNFEKNILKLETLIFENHEEEAQYDYLRWYEKSYREKIKPVDYREYDVFISHASPDKEDFARPLAEALKNIEVKVWFDGFELKLGDSLRKNIDQGLKNSKFGLLILSDSFFNRPWTEYELNGFVNREMGESKVILPIWHKVSKDEVLKFSPSLADKVALKSSDYNVQELAQKIKEVTFPPKFIP